MQRTAASGGPAHTNHEVWVTAPDLSILFLARDRRPCRGEEAQAVVGLGLQAHLLARCALQTLVLCLPPHMKQWLWTHPRYTL